MNAQNNLKDLYGSEYVAKYEKKPLGRLLRLKKYFYVNNSSVVADYGCGNAMLLEVIHNDIAEYHGVDFSAEMLEAAGRRAAKLKFANAYFYADDIVDFSHKHRNAFDAAFALDFSEHVLDDEWNDILKSIRSTLKPDGTLYLHTPNGNYFLEILKRYGILRQFPEHIAVRTPEHNLRLLKNAGFKIQKVHLLSHYECRQKMFHIFRHIPIVGKYFIARLLVIASRQ